MTIQYALIEAFRDTQLQMRENPALKSATLAMQAATRLYLNDFSAIDPCLKSTAPHISVLADTSLHCAQGQITPSKRVTVLNFANAYHPGGGVKKGAAAQEECLCRSSNLYAALTLPYMLKHYYKWNEKNTGDMGSDRIIYSPGVTVFKSDDIIPENLDPFFLTDVITCAAPIYNPDKKHPVTEDKLRAVFRSRIRNILETAAANGADILILGAFGCGVFGNPPELVASVFHELLIHNEYYRYFEKIIFAIKPSSEDCPNLSAFRKRFSSGS